MFSTFLDFFTGLKISQAKHLKSKNIWFWISISVNLGFLGVFKYYNFFAESFASALNNIGLHVNLWTIKVILPVGISFYTFHGLSYIIDLYKNKIKAEKIRLEKNKQYLLKLQQQQQQIDQLNSVIQTLDGKRQARATANDLARVLQYQQQRGTASTVRDLANQRLQSQAANQLYMDVNINPI